MSAPSVRRIKERGGGGGKITAMAAKPSKVATPVSEKSFFVRETHKGPTGKENPRPTSRIRAAAATATSQKPAIRPVPRIEKAGDVMESRARWSTSSVPRGRSSSPSQSSRVLSDLKKTNRVTRVSEEGLEKVSKCEKNQQKSGNFFISTEKITEKCKVGSTVLKNSKDSSNLEVGAEGTAQVHNESELKSKESEKSKTKAMDQYLGRGEADSSSNSHKLCLVKSTDAIKIHSDVNVSNNVQRSGDGDDFGSTESSGKSVNRSSALTEEGSSAKGVNKYPSKLHEKLAFLEGKVKRIASDIKRTKEMLDLNNPDASKVILSDIQEKITGIEKAMGNVVVNGTDVRMDLSKTSEDDTQEVKQEVVKEKSSGRGLKGDDLEARFFPHHKLLRDRTSLKTTSGSESKPKENSFVPINENPIALEMKQSKVSLRDSNVSTDNGEVQEMDGVVTSADQDSSLKVSSGKANAELKLTSDERIDEFDDQENIPVMVCEEIEEDCINQLNEIGRKTSTGGWFVSEGESVLLAHDDGSCSFYDVANSEEKAEYKPPVGLSSNIWRDCWIVRAPGADGCSGRYVVAASAGNALESGFCSWDFYNKQVQAFHIDEVNTNTRTTLAPLSNNTTYRRNALSTVMASENQQWWYKPCGPLIISTASCQKAVRVYDIRDGEEIMKWEVQRPILAMDYSSPLQWRNRGKVVLTEAGAVSLWDVSSVHPQALQSVSLSGREISALHVNNTDAESGGGVCQRISSSEAEGNDGVFCTSDSINVLDFRNPSGIALKIPRVGLDVQSVFSRGDSILIGCTNLRSAGKKQCPQVQQFSLRKQRLINTYELPELNAHSHYTAITQVWGNSNFIMGVCRLGLFAFDARKEDGMFEYGNAQKAREIIGPDDLYCPSFDYSGSRVLLISKDRPALCRYFP